LTQVYFKRKTGEIFGIEEDRGKREKKIKKSRKEWSI